MLDLTETYQLEANPAELLFAPYALYKSFKRAAKTYKYYKTGKDILEKKTPQVKNKSEKNWLKDLKWILILILVILLLPEIKEALKGLKK